MAKSAYKRGVENGTRDEMGVKKLQFAYYKEGKDYQLPDGDEMQAMYQMAKSNMERAQQNRFKHRVVRYETVEQLEEGIMQYWDYLMKANENKINLIPDVEGLCAFLGITRKTMWEWERNNTRGFTATIEQAKNDIAACKKQIGLQGKIPPLVLAMDFNNNHGYTQRQEVVVTPNNPLGDTVSNEELLAKYNAYAELDDGGTVALPESSEK